MSYTVNIAEIQQGVTVTANTNLVSVTANTQPISVLVNAVEFATGVTNANINGAGNLIITLSNSTQLDAGQVVFPGTYGNTTVAAYLPIYSGSIANATEIITLTANAGAQSNQIAGANAAIVTANTAMKSYVDAVTTAWTSNAGAQADQIAGANAAIVTANTALKAYTDAQITTTQSWVTGANAAIVTANTAMKAYVDAANSTQSTQITTTQSWVTGANAAIVTANTAMKSYVDGQITTTQSWVTGANAAIVTANTALKNYVDTGNTTQSNQITAVQNSVTGANAAIITANTALKNYVDTQDSAITTAWTANAGAQANQIAGANAAIITANTALKGYVDAQFTNLVGSAPAILDTLGEIATSLGNNASLSTTLLNSIAGSNAAIVTANTAMKGYVDAQITTTQGQITTANTALKSYVDTQDSAITTAWTANAGAQANQIAGANAAIVTANTALKGYTDNQITTANTALKAYTDNQITTANTALKAYTDNQITTANTALKAYVDTQDASITSAWTSNAGVQADAISALQSNAGAQANQIAGANVSIARIDANLGSFQTYANATFGASSYANANVASYLPVYAGNVALTNITRNGYAWAYNTDGSETWPSATGVSVAAGKMWYDDSTGTWNAGMGGGNITQQIGEELFRYGKASAAITDSPLQLVYKTGTVGGSNVITFAPVVAGITDSNQIIGCATEPIALNAFGRVTTYGIVNGITTNGTVYGETWADNDDIYYNPSTGGLTKTIPTAPGIKIFVGTVIKAGPGGSGSFVVKLSFSTSLASLSDVQTATNTAGQVLSYSSSAGYWKNTSLVADPGVAITTYTNGNITIGGTYSNTNVTAYLAGTVSVGNIASTNGYFWANGTAYSTGSGSAFTGDLASYSLTASGTGRILANAYPQGNITQISSYTQGILVTATPSYTSGNLNSANQTVIAAFNGNVNFLTSFAAGTRSTAGLLGYLGATATSSNVTMNVNDRIRGMQGGLDLNLNGKNWGALSSASNTLTPILVNGQTLNVYGSGQMGHAAAIGAAVTMTPVNGSISSQYVTGMFAGLTYATTGAGYTASNVQYARLYSGAVAGAANLTIANAVALHTYTNWAGANVTLVPNAYTILNEDVRSVISTVGNIVSTGTANKYGTMSTFNEKVTALGSASGTITANLALSSIHTVTATGDITINTTDIANAVSGSSFTIVITQDGTGSRLLTSNLKYVGGTKTLSTAAGAIDVISGFYDGTNYLVSLAKGFA